MRESRLKLDMNGKIEVNDGGSGPGLDSGGDVDCPVCEKSFESQRAMEAHVSGSNGDHKGLVGTDVRDGGAEAVPVEFPVNPDPEPDTKPNPGIAVDALGELEDQDDGRDLGVEQLDDDEADGTSSVVGTVVSLAVIVVGWRLWRGSGDSSASDVFLR